MCWIDSRGGLGGLGSTLAQIATSIQPELGLIIQAIQGISSMLGLDKCGVNKQNTQSVGQLQNQVQNMDPNQISDISLRAPVCGLRDHFTGYDGDFRNVKEMVKIICII